MMITSPTPKLFVRCLLPLFFLLGACNTTPPEQWTSVSIEVSNSKVLHEVIMMSMADLDYPMGPGTAPGNHEVASGWLESRSPFYGRGFRLRAFVKYSYTGLGEHLLECRVEKEVNESHQGLDSSRDEWKRVGDDNARRGHLLAKIKAYLAP